MPYVKRKRQVTYSSRPKRPIDKQILGVAAAVTNVSTSYTFYTVAVPATLVGIRWDLQYQPNTAINANYVWCLVIVREGSTASQCGLANAVALYQPEQNVLMWGCGYGSLDTTAGGGRAWIPHDQGATKTMRKLQGGDKIVLVTNASVAAAGYIVGGIQFFMKS